MESVTKDLKKQRASMSEDKYLIQAIKEEVVQD